MAINWPWSKIRYYDCGNGRVRTVYRNVNDVFPLYLGDLKASTKATLDVVDQIKGQLSTENQETIKSLLFKIDEKNSSAQQHLRAAYIIYSAAPCEKLEFLERTIDDIRNREGELRIVEMHVHQLLAIAGALKPSTARGAGLLDNERVSECLGRALDALTRPLSALQIASQIQRVPSLTQEWQSV